MARESAAREEEIFPAHDAAVLEKALEVPRAKKIRKVTANSHTAKNHSEREHSITLSIATAAPSETPAANPEAIAPYRIAKRAFDIAGASTLLVATAPVMGIVALLVKLSSPGPVILKQTRLTAGGKTFSMYKFRSMRSDAESKCGPVLAQANDARVTPIGRFIRMTRLDELPQFVNVIRGEMSLIGPRPERPEIAAQLRASLPQFDRRLEVKAGLTGLAQVEMGYSGCTDSYRRKLAFDRLYVQRQSIPLDLWIAARTVWVMFTGRGAR